MSKQEFAYKVFGKSDYSNDIVESYFKDWKVSGYNIELYVRLLKTRG